MYLLPLLKNCLCNFGKEDSEWCFWDPVALPAPTLLPSDGTVALVRLGQGTELLSSCHACSDLGSMKQWPPGVDSAWRREHVHFSSVNRRKLALGGSGGSGGSDGSGGSGGSWVGQGYIRLF